MAAELEILESPRFLAGSLADLEVTVYRDGTPTDPASAGTVTVADEDGNTLSSGAATIVTGAGKLRYTPTAAAMADVNRLTVTWASVVLGAETAITLTSRVEVVGDMLFTEQQARAHDGGAMADAAVYTDEAIRRAHDGIMDAFEGILGYPLGRRYVRETLDGEGRSKLRLTRPFVRTVRRIATRSGTTWTALSAGELAKVFWRRWGQLEYEGGSFAEGVQNVRVSYEAGREIPMELRRAALIVLRQQLVRTNIPDRALFLNNQDGQYRIAVPDGAQGVGRWFGLPEADAILARHFEASFW